MRVVALIPLLFAGAYAVCTTDFQNGMIVKRDTLIVIDEGKPVKIILPTIKPALFCSDTTKAKK